MEFRSSGIFYGNWVTMVTGLWMLMQIYVFINGIQIMEAEETVHFVVECLLCSFVLNKFVYFLHFRDILLNIFYFAIHFLKKFYSLEFSLFRNSVD